jgi:CRISPR-associated protein Cas2
VKQVVVYDIEDDRTRARLATLLEGYGRRVQKSVFECSLGERELKELVGRMQKELAGAPDAQVRVYRVCRKCLEASFGLGRVSRDDPQHCYIF